MSIDYKYGAVGTSPLSPMVNSPEHQLASMLQTYYNEDITGVPSEDINWEQWFTGYGDIAIYFEDAGSYNVSGSVDHNIEDLDHYTDIHVFVRSLKSDYNESAEKICFDIEKWIIRTLNHRKESLASQGIQFIEYQDSRSLPYFDGDKTDYDNIVYRKVISVYMKIRNINNIADSEDD